MIKYTALLIAMATSLTLTSNGFAQNVAPQAPAPVVTTPATPAVTSPAAPKETNEKTLRVFDAETYPSILFTYWEQVAIEDARKSRGLNRAPTADELERDLNRDPNDERVMPPPEERDIALSGIAYNGYKNWTIWLNGKRVTPDAIPKEALDLKVFKEYIEIKWFDEYTNQIFPIRLRAHQRFNIDNRLFLPG